MDTGVGAVFAANEIEKLRREAETGPIGKRRSSFELYALLRKCYWVAEMCQSHPNWRDGLHKLVAKQDKGDRNRRYVEEASSNYLLVARYVFSHGSSSADRSNASRYGKVMEEAGKRRLSPLSFERALRKQGGIDALYKRRFRGGTPPRRDVRGKTLWLTSPVTLPKEGEVTLVLRYNSNGSFTVVSNSYDLPRDEDKS